jgi:site-specific DNA-adenine methylase
VNFWSEGCRERLAKSVGKISHWEVRCADYREIEDVEATWFIDPPYIGMGHHYHSDELDYETLASWCKSRRGQVIVCELSGASWLPFVPFIETVNASKKNRKEVIWQRA